MDTLSSDNAGAAVADNQGTGPAAGASATAQPAGQVAGQSAPGEDIFKGIDPNRLPPELRSVHDSMLRDYRSKTEKLSETVKTQLAKELDPWKKDAEMYRQLSAHEEFVKQWNSYAERTNTQQQQQSAVQSLPPEIQERLQKVDMIEQKFQEAEAERAISVFKEAVDEKGEMLHPDFEKFVDIPLGTHPKTGDFSLMRACVELSPGESLTEKMEAGYQQAKAAYDRIFEEGKKAGMGRLQAKVLNSTQPPSNGTAAKTTTSMPKNAHEAMRLARQGIVVKSD